MHVIFALSYTFAPLSYVDPKSIFTENNASYLIMQVMQVNAS